LRICCGSDQEEGVGGAEGGKRDWRGLSRQGGVASGLDRLVRGGWHRVLDGRALTCVLPDWSSAALRDVVPPPWLTAIGSSPRETVRIFTPHTSSSRTMGRMTGPMPRPSPRTGGRAPTARARTLTRGVVRCPLRDRAGGTTLTRRRRGQRDVYPPSQGRALLTFPVRLAFSHRLAITPTPPISFSPRATAPAYDL
jgi:hypothetical protein